LFVFVVSLGFGCTKFQLRPSAGAFSSDAVKASVAGGVKPTGIVTDNGESEPRIPESSVTMAVAVFLVSASASAVKVSVGGGLGKLANVGAVKVRTFDPFVVVITHVPIEPPFIVCPLVQVPVTAAGFWFDAVGRGV
jgi:ABC-type methionine transport system permease subunit